MEDKQIEKVCEHTDLAVKGFFREYRWLSNFHDVPIMWMNMEFKSTEAAYQASKCLSIDGAKYFTILSGKEAKKESRNIIVRPNWNLIKLDIMAQLVFQKFLNDIKLREKLVDTWPKYLEETNYWNDTFWGVCNGIGENNLGKLLMSTREYFKKLEDLNNESI